MLLTRSGYARQLRVVLAQQLAISNTYRDATVVRALTRLHGKVAAGKRDGHVLLTIIVGVIVGVDTRIQAAGYWPTPYPGFPHPSCVRRCTPAVTGRSAGKPSPHSELRSRHAAEPP